MERSSTPTTSPQSALPTLASLEARVCPPIKRHPYSAAFGSMNPEQLGKLYDGIKQAGTLAGEIITYDGQVLDGWHRYIVSLSLGIKPNIFTLAEFAKSYGMTETPDALDFATSRNRDRRHLDHEGLVSLATTLAPLYADRAERRMSAGIKVENGEKGKASALAAKVVGIAPASVERAMAVVKNAPDLAEQAKKGEKKWSQAEREAKARPKSKSTGAKPSKPVVVDSDELKAEKAKKLVEAQEKARTLIAGEVAAFAEQPDIVWHGLGDENVDGKVIRRHLYSVRLGVDGIVLERRWLCSDHRPIVKPNGGIADAFLITAAHLTEIVAKLEKTPAPEAA